jgi:hypothetical protein
MWAFGKARYPEFLLLSLRWCPASLYACFDWDRSLMLVVACLTCLLLAFLICKRTNVNCILHPGVCFWHRPPWRPTFFGSHYGGGCGTGDWSPAGRKRPCLLATRPPWPPHPRVNVWIHIRTIDFETILKDRHRPPDQSYNTARNPHKRI